MTERVGVVILAGGSVSPAFAQVLGTPVKAEAVVGGVRSVDRVIQACRDFDHVVVGRPGLVEQVIPEGEGAVDNMALGLKALGPRELYILIPADTPFLEPSDVRGFAQWSLTQMIGGSRMCLVGLCPQDKFLRDYPGTPAKATTLKDGSFLAGALYGCNAEAFTIVEGLLREARRNRKSGMRLAARLGLGFVFKLLTGRLSIHEVETKVGDVTGVGLKLWTHASPRTVMDFDDPVEWEAVQRHAKHR